MSAELEAQAAQDLQWAGVADEADELSARPCEQPAECAAGAGDQQAVAGVVPADCG